MPTDKLRPLFAPDGRSVIVALDHIVNGFDRGWEYPPAALDQIIAGRPDGLMTTYGVIKHYRERLAGQTALILRLDVGPTYLTDAWPDFSHWAPFYTVDDALALGVDGVIVNLFVGGPVELETMRLAARVAADCTRHGLPCAIEALPIKSSGVPNPMDADAVAYASRLAAELGADLIKTYYTGDAASFERVTARCPVPVLIAGGPVIDSDLRLMEMVAGMLAGGGRGLFIGRNAWQHRDPAAVLRAIGSIVHDGASAEEAASELAAIIKLTTAAA